MNYDTERDRIFIPSRLAAEWLNQALNERYNVTKTSRMLKQKIGEGSLNNLTENYCKKWGRGFVWVGDDSAPDEQTRTDIECRLEYRKRRYP